jgi:hypothetical protein
LKPVNVAPDRAVADSHVWMIKLRETGALSWLFAYSKTRIQYKSCEIVVPYLS